jgi:hypothetical protein
LREELKKEGKQDKTKLVSGNKRKITVIFDLKKRESFEY